MSLSTKSSHVNFSSPFSFSINWEKKKSIFFIFLFLLDFSKAFITRFEILGFIRNSLWRFYLAFHVGSFIWLLSVIRLHIQWHLFCLIMFEFGDLNFFFRNTDLLFSFLSMCSSGHQISCSSSYTQSLKLKKFGCNCRLKKTFAIFVEKWVYLNKEKLLIGIQLKFSFSKEIIDYSGST